MNINIYLEDELAKSLNQLAKNTGHSRNAVIREAVREYIVHHEIKKWPSSVMNYKGDKNFKSFESHRSDLLPPKEDPLK